MTSMPRPLPQCSTRRRPTTTDIHRVYRQLSTGPYTITSEPGLRMRIDGFTIDDVGVRPSRISCLRCWR